MLLLLHVSAYDFRSVFYVPFCISVAEQRKHARIHEVIDVKSQLAPSSFPNPYKPSTYFMVVKMVLLNHYNPTGQNVFAEHLQAFNVLCGSQNGSVGQSTLDPPPPFRSDT